MFGSLLLLCYLATYTILATYTVSSENRLTTQSTTTEAVKYFAVGDTKNTYVGETGEISCHTAETAVSNCDVLKLLGDEFIYISKIHDQQGRHLTSIEERVLEVLGHLQEVRGTLHSRPERSAGANRVCETVHNATRALFEELETVKNRQAVAAALSTFQLLLFLAYLGVKIVLYTIKAVKKHQARRNKEDLELMESRLASRKAKRRSGASRAKGKSSPASPTQE